MGGTNSTVASGQAKTTERQQQINEYVAEVDEYDDLQNGDNDSKIENRVKSTDMTDGATPGVNPKDWTFPFENVILEGGGNKGLAYVGLFKCFEDIGMLGQIKRFGGASAGAITATLAAIGYSSEDIRIFLSENHKDVFMDHRCGYLSLIPNLLMSYGWNPGNKIYEWFGNAIEKKTGNPDITFYDFYRLKGIELCILVTNVNMLSPQYCHPKTTPDMPIRDALRMTMSMPGLFQAMEYDNHGQQDLYVDGGLLNNYPINCFDGWYLSMDTNDAFLVKMRSLKEMPELMSHASRFGRTGPNKTIGALLYEETEREVMRFQLESRSGVLEPQKPTKVTPLWEKKEKKWKEIDEAERKHKRICDAVDVFLKAIHKHNINDREFITKDELKSVLEDPEFDANSKRILFGQERTLDKVFTLLDKDGNNKIAYNELIKFIEERGIRMQMRIVGFGRVEVNSFGSFLGAVKDSLLLNMKYTAMTNHDYERTVGINTGHLGTLDYDLLEEDREFVVQRGYNSTLGFLRYFITKNPDLVKRREISAQDNQPSSIHSKGL